MDYVKIVKGSKEYLDTRQKFINAYKEIFSQEPFFEEFTDTEVEGIYESYCSEGCLLIVAMKEGDLVGFGAGVPISHCSHDMKTLAAEHFRLDDVFYNADMGVVSSYRGCGVAKMLVNMRIKYAIEAGFNTLFMRTIKDESMSASIYEKLGFSYLNEVQEVIHDRSRSDIPENDERVFLWKRI